MGGIGGNDVDMSAASCTRLLDRRLMLRSEKRRGIGAAAADAAAAAGEAMALGARLPDRRSGGGGAERRSMLGSDEAADDDWCGDVDTDEVMAARREGCYK